MKLALLTLCIAWAMPAHADTTLPQPPGARKSWADSCAARIDATTESLGFKRGAKLSLIPLVHEDGRQNRVHYVEYTVDEEFIVQVGEDSEPRADSSWESWEGLVGSGWFRRYKHRFAKITNDRTDGAAFKAPLDDCLKMGDPR